MHIRNCKSEQISTTQTHTPKNGQLSCNCFTAACRSSQEYVGVTVVESVEHLRLNWVKVVKFKQLLVGGALEGRDRKWLEVKQLGVRWVELRQNEVLE